MDGRERIEPQRPSLPHEPTEQEANKTPLPADVEYRFGWAGCLQVYRQGVMIGWMHEVGADEWLAYARRPRGVPATGIPLGKARRVAALSLITGWKG